MLLVFKIFLLISLAGLAYLAFFRLQSTLFFRLGAILLAASLSFFVILPDYSTRVAGFFGIGRGADFVLYLAQVLSYFLIVVLYIQLQKMERQITTLARAIAVQGAVKPIE